MSRLAAWSPIVALVAGFAAVGVFALAVEAGDSACPGPVDTSSSVVVGASPESGPAATSVGPPPPPPQASPSTEQTRSDDVTEAHLVGCVDGKPSEFDVRIDGGNCAGARLEPPGRLVGADDEVTFELTRGEFCVRVCVPATATSVDTREPGCKSDGDS